VILDNLIAQGKATPMLVVMPLGYGTPDMLASGAPGTFRPPALRERNAKKFGEALLTELIPRVERDYRVATDAGSRAIAGLSMGGFEALYVGLNNPDRFAWIGGFSSAMFDEAPASLSELSESANAKLRLLWIACGTDDSLIGANRKFREWLTTKHVRHVAVETPGVHNWLVWRRNLASFAPLLFR
jgi:enterochelin esterase family protein